MVEPLQVAVLDDYQSVARTVADWSPLAGRAEVTVFRDHLADEAALVERLRPFSVLCVMRERTPLPRSLLERLEQLRLIVSTGPRNAAIDLEAAAERGITVANTRSAPHGAMELTWALILAAARGLPGEMADLRAGGWQRGIGADLAGRTLGLIGLGRIGSRMAQVGLAFGMEVLAWSPNLTPERASAAGAALVGKEEILCRADFLSLHLVLGPTTRAIIGAAELALLRPHAWLVNTVRGPLVDEAALIAALRQRRIAGAALDVFALEPLPADHPFRQLDNVLATPHLGYVTRDTYALFYGDTVQAIRHWLDEGGGMAA
jgi:phosphoglycerate dehydrogenase-like enzyme